MPGPGEILLLLIVALVVLGPEEMPKALRNVGRLLGEARNFAAEATRIVLEDPPSDHPDQSKTDLDDDQHSDSIPKAQLHGYEPHPDIEGFALIDGRSAPVREVHPSSVAQRDSFNSDDDQKDTA